MCCKDPKKKKVEGQGQQLVWWAIKIKKKKTNENSELLKIK